MEGTMEGRCNEQEMRGKRDTIVLGVLQVEEEVKKWIDLLSLLNNFFLGQILNSLNPSTPPAATATKLATDTATDFTVASPPPPPPHPPQETTTAPPPPLPRPCHALATALAIATALATATTTATATPLPPPPPPHHRPRQRHCLGNPQQMLPQQPLPLPPSSPLLPPPEWGDFTLFCTWLWKKWMRIFPPLLEFSQIERTPRRSGTIAIFLVA
jgi:hypothetical protein